MRYIIGILSFFGLLCAGVFAYLVVINVPRGGETAEAGEPFDKPISVGKETVEQVSSYLRAIAAQNGEVGFHLSASAEGESGASQVHGEFSFVNLPGLLDKDLSSRGDLASDNCTKFEWKGPTRINKVEDGYIYVSSRVRVTLYKSVLSNCNVKVFGPDHKNVSARIRLQLDSVSGDVRISADRIDVENLGDYFENLFGLPDADTLSLLNAMDFFATFDPASIKLGFDGSSEKLLIKFSGIILDTSKAIKNN